MRLIVAIFCALLVSQSLIEHISSSVLPLDLDDNNGVENPEDRRYLPTLTGNGQSQDPEEPKPKDLGDDEDPGIALANKVSSVFIDALTKKAELPRTDNDVDDEEEPEGENLNEKGLGEMSETGCRHVLLKDQTPKEMCESKIGSILDKVAQQCSGGLLKVCAVSDKYKDKCRDWVERKVCTPMRESSFLQKVSDEVRTESVKHCAEKLEEVCVKVHKVTTKACTKAITKVCDTAPVDFISNKCKSLLIDRACS